MNTRNPNPPPTGLKFGFLMFGGRNRTRTCDPIDVNDVLYLCGLFSQLFFLLCAYSRSYVLLEIERIIIEGFLIISILQIHIPEHRRILRRTLLQLDLTMLQGATGRKGFPKGALLCAFIVMKCESFSDISVCGLSQLQSADCLLL